MFNSGRALLTWRFFGILLDKKTHHWGGAPSEKLPFSNLAGNVVKVKQCILKKATLNE